jgi:hypothetical protein
MWRWSPPPTISTRLDVFCRLSREVRSHSLQVLADDTKNLPRALLSTIKTNAEHPCPRCLVKKIDTIKMGTRLDMLHRCGNVRVDNHIRRTTVERARRLVFEQGIPLSSKRIKDILGKSSGVPTHVCYNIRRVFGLILMHIALECLLDEA